jgi:hypothetical protein
MFEESRERRHALFQAFWIVEPVNPDHEGTAIEAREHAFDHAVFSAARASCAKTSVLMPIGNALTSIWRPSISHH